MTRGPPNLPAIRKGACARALSLAGLAHAAGFLSECLLARARPSWRVFLRRRVAVGRIRKGDLGIRLGAER